MSFVQDEPDKNDRLLMFSMLGVVLVTLLAFGFQYMNRQRQPAPAAAAPVITTAIQPPAAIAPAEPGPIPMEQRVSSTYVPNMQVAPIVQQPEYQPEAPRYTVPRAYNGRQNRKLNGILGATDEN